MTVEPIGLLALVLGVLSIMLGPTFAVYVSMIFMLFGSSAALLLPAIGGSSIQPAHLQLGFLVICFVSRSDILRAAVRGVAFPRAGFWLLLTVVYGICSAYFMPRLFAGLTYVFAARAETNTGYILVPLGPTGGNVTQTIYFTADFICFLAFYAYAGTKEGKIVIGSVALICAVLNLVFALADLVTYWSNTAELLGFIRNSNYRMLDDTEVAGFKRIVGSYSEAGVFATMTLGSFAFTGRLWLCGIYPRLTFTISILSILAVIFATSTTGYFGLFALLVIMYLGSLVRTLMGPVTIQTISFVAIFPILVAVLLISVALNDQLWLYIQDLMNTMIFNKFSTDSGVERSAWTRQALITFYDTFGLGAGIGSLRASSFVVAVLASMGVVGAITYGAFLFCLFFGGRNQRQEADVFEDAFQQAAKSTCLALLLCASVAGAFVDLSLIFFSYAGLACAESVSSPLPSIAVGRRPRGLQSFPPSNPLGPQTAR
jgi:hypothetical protein